MFNFNIYSSLLLIGFTLAVIYILLLLIRAVREQRVSDYLAAGILTVGALYVAQWMLGFAGWYDERDARTTFMFYVQWDNVLLLGPLVLLYFRSVTNTDFRWRRKYWWHFLPWLLLLLPKLGVIAYDWGYYRWLTGQEFICFDGSRGPASEWENIHGIFTFDATFVLIRLVTLGYLVVTARAYLGYLKYLEREFTNPAELRLPGLGYLVFLLVAGIALTSFIEFRTLLMDDSGYVDAWFSYFSMSVLLIFAGIQFYAVDARLTRTLRFLPDEGVSVPETPDEELLPWADKLILRLEEHADHLNPELKLGDLAEAIGTNASVLSRVINQVHGQNFNDFINTRRCDAFLKKIAEGEHLRHTLLSLALDAGFNSKSTFNRAFRKLKGISPGQAVKRVGSN